MSKSGFGRISRKNCEYFSQPVLYPILEVDESLFAIEGNKQNDRFLFCYF